MPIYEYECDQCHKKIELLQKVSDPPLAVCPHCQGALQRVVSAAGLQFKGSGWYITDYAKKNGQATAPSKEEKKTEGASSSDNTANSDSAAKKESPAAKPKDSAKD